MNWNAKYVRLVLLASLSSLTFLLCSFLVAHYENSELIVGSSMIVAGILFGVFVLLPHTQYSKLGLFRTVFLVIVPVLLLGITGWIVEEIIQVADALIDYYFPSMVWSAACAVGGCAWVFVLANAVVWTAKLERTALFWRHVSLVALLVASLIFLSLENFCLFFCSKWNEPVMYFSASLLVLGTPLGLTTALFFGTKSLPVVRP